MSQPTTITDLTINSTDINKSLFTIENHNALKTLFPDYDNDTIARYLIARNNDLTKSTELLTKAHNWKAKHAPVLKRDCLPELTTGKLYCHGTDREGRPLLIFRSCFHDANNRDIETMARSVLWWAEIALRRLPDNKTKFTVIIDRDGAGMANGDIEFIRTFASLFQDQFPERLYRCIVVPANVLFWSVWKVVSVFVHPVTREKVKTLMFQSALSEYVDPEFIPVRLGGKCTYELNLNDYEDPYSEEAITTVLAKRSDPYTPHDQGTFFQTEDAATTDF